MDDEQNAFQCRVGRDRRSWGKSEVRAQIESRKKEYVIGREVKQSNRGSKGQINDGTRGREPWPWTDSKSVSDTQDIHLRKGPYQETKMRILTTIND